MRMILQASAVAFVLIGAFQPASCVKSGKAGQLGRVVFLVLPEINFPPQKRGVGILPMGSI